MMERDRSSKLAGFCSTIGSFSLLCEKCSQIFEGEVSDTIQMAESRARTVEIRDELRVRRDRRVRNVCKEPKHEHSDRFPPSVDRRVDVHRSRFAVLCGARLPRRQRL